MSDLSNIARVVNGPILFVTAISLFFLIGITAVMVYFTFRYRRSRNPNPEDIHGHTALEVAWTVIPTLLAFGMFWYGWVGYKLMKSPPKDALQVHVTARQWSWMHTYANGVQSDTLNVPVGKPVKLNLESKDVIHSYYIPAFKVKQDVVPGMKNLFLWFTAEKVGYYDVLCAEYCGLEHSGMHTMVHVMPDDEFNSWLKTEGAKVVQMKKTLAQGAGGAGGEAELAAVGKKLATAKGCVACHSTDGSRIVGPSFKGIYGSNVTVMTNGKERTIKVDDEYIRHSMLEPKADIVKGFQPLMPSQKGLVTDDEIKALTAYIKSLQ